MKSNHQFIESLEARIAPALLINGGNLLGGAGNPTTGESSTGANNVTLVKVLSGQALVFYNNGTITGISVGQHTKLDITGDIFGDIVTNLGPDGRLTDSDGNPNNGEDGGLLTGFGIKGIATHPFGPEKGSIGRIIAGGQVKNINIAGEIAGIYSGDGIFRDGPTATVNAGIDFNTVQSGPQLTFSFKQGDSAPNGNATIKNVTIDTARQLEIFSGSGANGDDGAGLPGGNIINVTVNKTLQGQGDQPVIYLHAGDGGAGTAGGGVGGSITTFNDQGSIAYVKVQTGNGGNSPGATGGAGGTFQQSTIVSSSTRYDFLLGNGGSGDKGGVGGGIDTVTFTNNITGGKSLIATADFNNDGRADVVLLNTLTGESTVSLGTDTPGHPGEANFRVVTTQLGTSPDGTLVHTPFLPSEGSNPTALVVGDFNRDGLLDFAVSFASTNSIGIYTNTTGTADPLNPGVALDGTFSATRQDLGFSPTSIVVGDFGGTGFADLAVVSALKFNAAQSSFSSNVYVDHNDGLGHLTIDASPAAVLPGTATVAAGAQVSDATTGALTGANLFVGTNAGQVYPVQFLQGAATIGAAFGAFTTSVPVDGLDAVSTGSGDLVLAFTKDVNALAEGGGDTTIAAQALVNVFSLNTAGVQTSVRALTPANGTVNAHFLAGSSLVGTVSPGALTIWDVTGTSQNYSTVASLASTGALLDFSATQLNGAYQFAASGAANNRFYFTSGNPGTTDGIKAFLASETDYRPRVISVATGNGGDGDAFAGGTGGSVKTFKYTQTLGPGVIEAGGAYTTSLVTGHGGSSNADVGGKGGGVRKSDFTMTPGYLTFGDDTTTAAFKTGDGGSGTSGGDGGSLQKVSFASVLAEPFGTGINLDSVALNILAGNGGIGTVETGGGGGNVLLAGQSSISGVTFIDDDSVQKDQPALLVKGGNGGQGVSAGGAGGSLENVGSQNVSSGGAVLLTTELASAQVSSGSGGAATNGTGGAGGSITSTNVTASRTFPTVVIAGVGYVHADEPNGIDGSVAVTAGGGGAGRGGLGGSGGTITQSTVGSVNGDPGKNYGAFVQAGAGGDGDAGGGAGGFVTKVRMSSPQDSSLYAAVIAAGNGGNALSGGIGGAGGDVIGVKQTKDVNSAINVIQAGNGGRGAGDVGGAGGSVAKVNTAGFLGVPSSNFSPLYYGAYHSTASTPDEIASLFASAGSAGIPQGVFAGRGADGADNGSVTKIVARQIAAIGASVQANGTFAPASLVDGITADLVGYQQVRNSSGVADGTFHSQGGTGVSPSTAVPIDGFILASVIGNITTIDSGHTDQFTFTS